MKRAIGLVLLLAVLVGIVSCGGNSANSIVGKWKYVDTVVKQGTEMTQEDWDYLKEEKEQLLGEGNWLEFKANRKMKSSAGGNRSVRYNLYNNNTKIGIRAMVVEEFVDIVELTDNKLSLSYEDDDFVYVYEREY